MENLEEEQGIDIREYLGIIDRRKKIIIPILGIVFLSTVFFTFRAPNIYRAATTLIVETRNERISLPFTYSPMGRNLLQNYCQLLKSRTLAERVVINLKESNSAISVIASSNPVQVVRNAISVKPIRETDLIEVSTQARSAEEAALIANTVAEEFVEQQLSVVRGEFTEQRRFLEEQLPMVEARLAESGEKLKEFKEANQLVSLSEETREQTKQLLEFDLQYGQIQTEYDATLRRLDYLKTQLAKQKESLVNDITRITSLFILQLRDELVALETNYSLFLVQGLSSEHPKLLALKNSITEVKEKLREETRKILSRDFPVSDPLSFSHELADKILLLEVEVAALMAKKDALSHIRDNLSSRLRSLPEKELHLVSLEREYQISANTYGMLMEKYEEVKIAEAGKIANVRVVDRATVSGSPVRPRKKLNLFLGIILGLGLGLGSAFLLEYMDTSIKSLAEVEKLVSLPVLGAIPRMRTRANRKDEIARIASHLITHQVPKSPISETFRAIRTNLQFVNPDDPVKTILVTSSVPAEGKTTVAANLAIVLAQLGAKTIIVDGDLRKPVMHKLFGLDANHGLTDLLTGKAALSGVIESTQIENLKLLPAGPTPPNPSELLGSKRMKNLIQRLKENFDYVVFDSPPTVPVTDAAVLGTEMDGTLVVLQIGKTDRHAIARTKEMLENVRAKILGLILNNTPSAYSGYARYHYYHYYHYYHHSYPESKKRRRLVPAIALFLAGLVSTVAVALGWFYWAKGSRSSSESTQAQFIATETTPSLNPALGISGEASWKNPVGSKEPVHRNGKPVVSVPEDVSLMKSSFSESSTQSVETKLPSHGAQITNLRIFFGQGEPLVEPRYHFVLKAVAHALKKDAKLAIEIRGYSDNSRGEKDNLILSENRAAVVAAHLIKVHGVDPGRLSFKGYGVADPIADNSTPEGRALNRRVEFRVKSK